MFGISWTELLVVLLGALVVLGPKDMVIMAGKAGAWMRSLQMHWHDVKTHFHQAVDQSGVYHEMKDFYRDVTPSSRPSEPRSFSEDTAVPPSPPQKPSAHGPHV
jgi:sec-independent protein translocase protein TatB